jgi:thiamine biosynthesis lipoprotein
MWTFRAMATDISVAAPTLSSDAERMLAAQAADQFDAAEQRFSRFREDSELSRLNQATEGVRVSAAMLEALLAARAHVAVTDGVFDPTVGGALIAAGYDRSFVPGELDRPRDVGAIAGGRAHFEEIQIDEASRRVWRPAHVRLDFGGFVKGRTVDAAAAHAPDNALVDAGGDMVLRGAGPDGDGWLVDIEDPFDSDATLLTLRVRDRAVATSAANRRRWRVGARESHHLIDPRTAAPARTDLAQVTVLADTAERAEVLAKVAFVLGETAGTPFLEKHRDIGAVLVRADGGVSCIGALEVCHA